ncbi:hypothetical protein ABPG75_003810 [Micractinium tetrahymenae]
MSALKVVQLFHSKRRFKVLLTNLCRSAAHVRTDADILRLGSPEPVLTTKRWLPPNHGLRVHVAGEEELEGALAALESAMCPAPRLGSRRLQLAASAWFVLPSGALVSAAALAGAHGRQLLQERWPTAAVREEAGGGSARWLTVEWRASNCVECP